MAMTIRKGVIPAAGLGTRFLPATKAQPKEMLPVVDTPVIEYAVRELVSSGIDDIIIVTGRGKRAIEDHFDKSIELETHFRRNGKPHLSDDISKEYDAHIHFIRQKEPLGLGHAVLQAERHIGDDPFVVILADEIYDSDVPCIKSLIDQYNITGESVIGLREVPLSEVHRYGIATVEDDRASVPRITDLVEKPSAEVAPSRLAICGRYVLRPEVFDCLRSITPGVNGEIQLTDALKILLHRRPMHGLRINAPVYDVGDKMGFLQATVDYALKRQDLGPEFYRFLVSRVEAIAERQLRDAAAAREGEVL